MNYIDELQRYWEKIIDRLPDQQEETWLHRKIQRLVEHGKHIQRVTFEIHPFQRHAYDENVTLHYVLNLSLLLKEGRHFYLEEGIFRGTVHFQGDKWVHHSVETESPLKEAERITSAFIEKDDRQREFSYNRREAVRYADRWWDSYNPAYRHFEVDCTNYISQCLRAGGAPMWGQPNRSKGWWYGSGNWSYSWAVAHALRWYLSGSRKGLTATEVSSADQLSLGDVICYDFEGDGRFNHNTIVVKKDANGMPLVNAHTSNSRHRYWAYEDSTAYTPSIQYKFFHIDG
ncbi:amidase domain-containing protein [Halobacillus litoralis]|uniref:amidase domain-containing protein n=1 Tax=Halobacillus litoralis TaxID=45668 RepID=UPI001CD1A1A8|nr:amidase domain-containing protein [Halobacillus litoralis]MCA0969785.1 amidase domain-containing protein [Halobacillus litoralis]